MKTLRSACVLLAVCFAGSVAMADTRLVAIADTRGGTFDLYVNTNVLNTIVTRILALDPPADAVLVAGDMINTPDNVDGNYRQFTNCMAPLAAAGIPTYCAIGNHESNSDPWYPAWAEAFDFPTNGPAGWEELVYYVDVGDARIIALDAFTDGTNWVRDTIAYPSSGYTCKIPVSHRNWVRTIAGTNSPTPFDIVFSHGVAYPFTYAHATLLEDCLDQNPVYRDLFCELLSDIKATVHFTGHEHLYMRRMIDTRYSTNFTHTVPHIGIVAGASFHTDFVDDPVDVEILVQETHCFTVVDLDPVTHTGTATTYADNGTTVLDFVPLRGKHARAQLNMKIGDKPR